MCHDEHLPLVQLKADGCDVPKQAECLKLRSERQLEVMAIPNLVIRRPSVVQVHRLAFRVLNFANNFTMLSK